MDAGPPLRDIACYVLVAQRLSFSGAAAELGMSQPAVSQTIARLERALDLRLFERSSREVQLTYAGKLLLAHAEDLIERAQAFTAEAARLSASDGQSIRLAYCPLTGSLAAKVVRRLANRTPPITVELRPAAWSAATADLTRDAVAIMSTPFPAGYASTGRFQIPVRHLAVSAMDPLARATRVRWEQLDRYPVLMSSHRPPGSLWAQLAQRLQAANVIYREAEIPDDWTAALDLAAARRGVLATPLPLTDTVRRPDIVFVPLDAALTMTYGIVWSPEHAGPNTLAVVQAIQEHLRLGGRSDPGSGRHGG